MQIVAGGQYGSRRGVVEGVSPYPNRLHHLTETMPMRDHPKIDQTLGRFGPDDALYPGCKGLPYGA